MHFDQREQAALREVGLDADDLRRASALVAEAVEGAAADLEAFFDRETVYSDMDLAHGADDHAEHAVRFLDTYTHADELRGWLRFESWGVAVADGRVLGEDAVELTLEGRHGRTRFATSPGAL